LNKSLNLSDLPEITDSSQKKSKDQTGIAKITEVEREEDEIEVTEL